MVITQKYQTKTLVIFKVGSILLLFGLFVVNIQFISILTVK